MTQQAKRTSDAQLPVPISVGRIHGLTDFLCGEQQTYAQLPAAAAATAHGLSSWVIRTVDLGVTEVSSGAWFANDLQTIHSAAYAQPHRPPSRSHQPTQSGPTKPAARGTIVLNDLHANSFLVQEQSEGTVLWNANFPTNLVPRGLVSYFTFNIALGGMMIDASYPSNYQGIVVFQGGTMSTQNPLVLPLEDTVEQVIWNALTSIHIPDRGALAASLHDLQKAIKDEDDPAFPSISIPSLKNFLGFLKTNQKFKLPIISATPECNIYASWKHGLDHVFSVHFLANNNIRFVIFRPNSKHSDRTIRLSGTATTDVLVEIATLHGVQDWACR